MSGTWGPGANDKTTCSLASSKHGGLPGIRLKSLYIEAHCFKPECSSEQDRVSILFMCGCRGHKLSRLPFAIGGSSPKPPTLNERRLDSPSDGAWQSHIAERLGWGYWCSSLWETQSAIRRKTEEPSQEDLRANLTILPLASP